MWGVCIYEYYFTILLFYCIFNQINAALVHKNLKNIFKNYNYYTGSVCVLYAVYNNTYYSCNSGSRTQEMFHHLYLS